MALPILDGNQSATTLSTILDGGQHIPAHTVVSLGSTAISNITSAVSGSVVSVSNFPASQSTTFGAVTGSVSVLNFPSTQTISGMVTANVFGKNVNSETLLPIPIIAFDENVEGNPQAKVIPVQLTTDQGTIAGGNPLPISGTVTADVIGYNYQEGGTAQIPVKWDNSDQNYIPIGPSVDPIPLPISGTVTANADLTSSLEALNNYANYYDAAWPIKYFNTHGGDPLPISGTVTAQLNYVAGSAVGIDGAGCDLAGVRIGYNSNITNEFVIVTENSGLPIQGTVTVANSVTIASLPAISGTVTVGNSVTIGSLPAISGTVTASLSKPTWTDYSGTVVTANSAVTAISTTSRNYLLAQVTTGQMFLNIGATATTGNSVYFSAGQGFAWETSVPQGIVSIISSVTGTNYVLKDG